MANVITITVWTIAIRIIGFFQLQTGHSSVRPEGFLLKVAGNILTTHGSENGIEPPSSGSLSREYVALTCLPSGEQPDSNGKIHHF